MVKDLNMLFINKGKFWIIGKRCGVKGIKCSNWKMIHFGMKTWLLFYAHHTIISFIFTAAWRWSGRHLLPVRARWLTRAFLCRVFSRSSGFHPQPKSIQIRLKDYPQMPIVNVGVKTQTSLCVSPAIKWRFTKVVHHLSPEVRWDRL